ncbi:hypothetical protein H4R20_000238 [Coemansia guatemalensis]|uniref:F-box domain-containing protein n=1 Tax=Coemansia guatemalensis TaxID=2761395 RepID=A0A9W8HZ92_9FUNG|nr:hypothetical protein H4R20_000238 [Coemansia guatemalensis]
MWKLSWIKSGSQSDPDSGDNSEDHSSTYRGSAMGCAETDSGGAPTLMIDSAPSEGAPMCPRSITSAYTPTSPLSLSQPSSMRSFTKLSAGQPSSYPSSRLPPMGVTAPVPPGQGSIKRKDSFVSSTGRLTEVERTTPMDGKLDFLTYLPYEIAMVIVIYADFPAITTISEVSRSWNRFAHDNSVWRRLFLQQKEWRTQRALTTAGNHAAKHRNVLANSNPGLYATGSSPSSLLSTSAGVSGTNTPRIGDDSLSTATAASTLTDRILSAYTGSSLRPAINLQHMVAPSPTLSMISGFAGQQQRQQQQQLQPPQRRATADWRYLFQQRIELDRHWLKGIADIQVLAGHADSVYCVQYDHEKIVTGSRDRTIKIWDAETMQCLRTMTGHTASVLCLKYNDSALVTGSSDATVIVWDWETGNPRLRLSSHAAGVLDVAFNEDHIVSCSKDCTIKVWRRDSGKLLRTMAGHRGPVNAVQLHGNKIVSASGDSLIKMWDLKTGALIRTFTGHTRGLACVQFDGKTIVSGSSDQLIKVWDADSGRCKQTLRGHKDLVRTLHFDGGRRAVSGSYDQTIKVWDIVTGECTLDLKDVHTSWVFDVQFTASRIVSTSQDQKIVIWDFAKGLDVAAIN